MKREKQDSNIGWLKLISFFLGLIKGQKVKFFIWTIIIFLGAFGGLIITFLVGMIVDFFINYSAGDSLQTFYLYCASIMVIFLLVVIFRLQGKKVLWGLAINADYTLRVRSFEKLMEFPLHWHGKENSGSRVQKIHTAGKAIGSLVQVMSNNVLSILATFIGVLGAFAVLSPRFLLFVAVYICIFIIFERYSNKRLSKLHIDVNKANEQASGTYYEGANNILSVKSLGATKTMTTHLTKKEGKRKFSWMRVRVSVINRWTRFQILNGFALSVFLLLVGFEFVAGSITAGLILVYYNYYEKLRKATADITQISIRLVEDRAAIQRVLPILEEQAENWFGKKLFPKKWSKISVKDISFSYNDQSGKRFKIEKLSFQTPVHKKVGLVGHSGSGKSTIAKLFMGIHPIEKGSITIGNTSFYDLKHEEITKHISIVLQEPELFNLSLKENVTLLKPFDKKRFQNAIDIAQLTSIIDKLPNGIDTLIGEKGYKLSGGERQRVGIARAIYKDTPIIILDEATSALDSTTEQKIQNSIEKNLKKKTMFIIAHRLSTLRHVDEIFAFKKGKLVEKGSFSELEKKKNGYFRSLWLAQKRTE
jgi:ABC-type multidrug transport system fused ATPase/permease subunit